MSKKQAGEDMDGILRHLRSASKYVTNEYTQNCGHRRFSLQAARVAYHRLSLLLID
jgi:hypothetical protein